MEIKYLVFPGSIVTQPQGHLSWVDHGAIIQLFGVKKDECIVITETGSGDQERAERKYPNLQILQPQESGIYEL